MPWGGWAYKMPVDFSMPVLVVDDYQTVVRIVRSLLRQAGFTEVDEAGDGEEALTKMKERQYGLVITDWHMAPVDGIELVKQAKADDSLKGTPIILISAEASPESVAAAKDAGAAGYVLKPFDSQTLKARIETALASA
jgi:two-component system, chemotaxis family, chemotaxis protein CheY